MNAKILVVDDEESLCDILKFNLEKEGYSVDCAYSAVDALEMDLTQYQLFIVDIMMERLSGYDFVQRLRATSATEQLPIGGDDYITKPFVIPEVLARVRAVLRRSKDFMPKAFREGNDLSTYLPDVTYRSIRIDQNEKECYIDEKAVPLTRTEFELMLFFLTHRNRIYSREEIISSVWSSDVFVSNRTIDTNITRLRKKLGEYGNNIITRLGFGYGFKESD